MKTTLFTACIICLSVLSVSAQPAERAAIRQKLLERFDTDGDGQLSAAERERAKKLVEEIGKRKGDEDRPQTIFAGKTDLYKVESGPDEVDVVETFLLHDDTRNKDIPLRLTVPKSDGKHPLIIFCHGALGSKDGYQPLATHWASHGYVVIQPTFDDSISQMTEEEKKKVTSIVGLLNGPQVNKAWDQRPKDVHYVIDSLDLLEKKIPQLAGKIDRARIGVGGHSYGAHTSMLISGMLLRHPALREPPDFHDDRVKAIVMISPQGTGLTVNEESYKSMRGPILMITGDNDGSPRRGDEGKAGPWRKEAYDGCPPGDKYLLWVKDAHHGFGGIAGRSPFPGSGPGAPDQVILIQSTGLAFWDAYLRGDGTAMAYLANADSLASGLATVTRK